MSDETIQARVLPNAAGGRGVHVGGSWRVKVLEAP